MPFETPSLPELVARAAADLAPAALRRADAEVLARVHAGAAYGLYGYQDWIARQILPDTADEEMLLRIAKLRLKQQRLPAVAASGTVGCTGTAGAPVTAGALLQASDGRRYRVTAGVVLGAGVTSVAVEAVEAGQLGNIDEGESLSFISPVLGVADVCTVLAPGLSGGSDEESLESLRQRVIRSYRVIPHGGDADDYVTWALEAPGVTRAWCVRNYLGPGTVGVFIVRDDDADPIPDAAELATAHAYIESQAPVLGELYVLAPTPAPQHFQLSITPDTPAVRAAVEASLRELIASEAQAGQTLPRTHVSAAISNSPGEQDHDLVAPAADVTFEIYELPTFGSITWL